MKVVEEIQPVPEPEWILDRTGSGPLYWRRESPEYNSRWVIDSGFAPD
jgi:hypothetical protein